MITRRQLIKTGMAGSVVLLAAGFLASPQPDLPAASQGHLVFLQTGDAQIIRSLAPVMLGMAGLALEDIVHGVDVAIANLLPAVQQELRQLFDLLGNRWVIAGGGAGWPASTARGHRRQRLIWPPSCDAGSKARCCCCVPAIRRCMH